MRICVVFRQDVRLDGPVECYPRSCVRSLESTGNKVTVAGEGHEIGTIDQLDQNDFDLLLEIENGRNSKGELHFQQDEYQWKIPTAAWLIDSHGHADLHKLVSKSYDHILFAVWAKRDLYTEHPSTHWAPCATDLRWFGYSHFQTTEPEYDFGFFGSKGGLPRADPLIDVCKKNGWTYNVRQVTKPRKHKWPKCGEAMATCRNLFNHGQKHDGPNQRVMESMVMKRPLLTDGTDDRDGMDKLFVEGYHYIGYESYEHSDLEERCKWMLDHPKETKQIAKQAFEEVCRNHTIDARMSLLMEVV